jgi:hypothetical protein
MVCTVQRFNHDPPAACNGVSHPGFEQGVSGDTGFGQPQLAVQAGNLPACGLLKGHDLGCGQVQGGLVLCKVQIPLQW